MDITLQGLALVVAITGGLAQAIKMAFLSTKTQYIPIISVALGVLVASIIAGGHFTPEIYITGIVGGLTASGLYDQIKRGIEIVKGE